MKIYGEYQDEARLKVLEYEKRHRNMAATVNLLEHRIRCEEGSSLVSKNKAEQERRSTSSEIAQYQSMINSYQVKSTTDSQNGLRERLETAWLLQPKMAIDDEPQNILVSKANDAEQEAHCARVAVSERDEMYLIGERAVQERDAKMNEEIKIARDRAHQANALHDRATLRDQEFVEVTCELAASRQRPLMRNPITSVRSLQCPKRSKRHDKSSRSKRALCTSWQRRTRNSSRARMPPKSLSWRTQKMDELY